MVGGRFLILSLSILLWTVAASEDQSLHEDVTDPAVRSAILSKFHKAKAEHEEHKSLFLNAKTIKTLDTAGKKKDELSPAARAKMIEKMKKLRAQIEADFNDNTKFGRRADCSYP